MSYFFGYKMGLVPQIIFVTLTVVVCVAQKEGLQSDNQGKFNWRGLTVLVQRLNGISTKMLLFI